MNHDVLTGPRLSLSRQTGNDPALTGLLRVFKDYYPEIIVGDATRGKASPFNVSPLVESVQLYEKKLMTVCSTPILSGEIGLTRSSELTPNSRFRDRRSL